MTKGAKLSTDHPIDKLLEIAQQKMGLKTRTDTHTVSGISAPACSKIRKERLVASAEIILRLHDVTDVPVQEIRDMLGVRKFTYIPPVATNAQPSGDQQTAQN